MKNNFFTPNPSSHPLSRWEKVYPTLFILVILISCLILFLSGCGGPPHGNFQSALQSQPYVVNLSPPPYQFVNALDRIEITFSKPIHKDSVNPGSILVLSGEIDPAEYPDTDSLHDDVQERKIQSIDGSLTADADKITWIAPQPIQQGSVTLVVTPDVVGEDRVPFNQQPGEDPAPFFAVFRLSQGASDLSNSNPNSAGGPSDSNSNDPLKIRPASLVLNEILYDASGSDTDGNEFIELYGTPLADLDGYQIVIVNGGDGNIIDTITLPENTKIPDDGIFLIADSRTNQAKITNIPGADFIDNFDPQNGPDSIQLLDSQGNLLDAAAYGAGNMAQGKNGLATGEGSPAPNVSAGHSISREQGEDINDNGIDFVDREPPTPGRL